MALAACYSYQIVDVWIEENNGRRIGLDDVKARLEELFRKQKIDASVVVEGGKLSCNYKTRNFQTYEQLDDGSYGEQLIRTVGPQKDGFSIVAFEQKSIDRGWHDRTFRTSPPQ